MPNHAPCFLLIPYTAPLQHLLYIQFSVYPAAYPPERCCAEEICRAQWNFYQRSGAQSFCSEMTSAAGILTTATMFVTLTDSLL